MGRQSSEMQSANDLNWCFFRCSRNFFVDEKFLAAQKGWTWLITTFSKFFEENQIDQTNRHGIIRRES